MQVLNIVSFIFVSILLFIAISGYTLLSAGYASVVLWVIAGVHVILLFRMSSRYLIVLDQSISYSFIIIFS